MARIDTLANFVTDVATAIKNKTGKTDAITPANFDTEIESIEGGGKYAPRKISFSGYTGTELNDEIANLDTSKVTDMSSMFNNCSNITSLDLSNFNTSNVTSLSNTFKNCSKLTSLDLNYFDTLKVTSLDSTFYSCTNLESIYVNNWITSNVNNMRQVFANCNTLTSLNLSNWTTSNVSSMAYMFFGCKSLKHLDVRSFDFTKISSYDNVFNNVPTDCEIIVKDDTAKTWITEKFTTLTNVKTVAEKEAETSA